MAISQTRDYSLTGASTRAAFEAGLVSANWYQTPVPRSTMKQLMARRDGPAMRDTIIWLGAMALSGWGACYFWPTLACLPFFFIYGVLYGSACDSRWHECGHGTAFKTPWMNNLVYQIASFMEMRNPTTWRWSHARHHTDTLIVGRDAEIAVMRPPNLLRIALNFFGLIDTVTAFWILLRNAAGLLSDDERDMVPQSEQGKVVRDARFHMAIYAATLTLAIYYRSILPFMFVGLPRFYGSWHLTLTGLLQHIGLADNVLDHRMNSRTVYLNPLSRFIYWNMNYHAEHHMFPMVPYHALPQLHELVKHDMPAANPSMWHAYREVFPVILRQLRYEDAFLQRNLPPGAHPYRPAPEASTQAAE